MNIIWDPINQMDQFESEKPVVITCPCTQQYQALLLIQSELCLSQQWNIIMGRKCGSAEWMIGEFHANRFLGYWLTGVLSLFESIFNALWTVVGSVSLLVIRGYGGTFVTCSHCCSSMWCQVVVWYRRRCVAVGVCGWWCVDWERERDGERGYLHVETNNTEGMRLMVLHGNVSIKKLRKAERSTSS